MSTETKTIRQIRIAKVELGDVTQLGDTERILLAMESRLDKEIFYLIIQTESYEAVVK